MADVTVDLRISVEDLDQIEQVAERIKKVARVKAIGYEEIGFGIKVMRVYILVDDKVEGFDTIEDKLRAVEGVSEVDVMGMDRDSF